MDAIIFITICLFIVYGMDKQAVEDTPISSVEPVVEDTTRVAILNETFYEDEDAFMEIAHVLGFPKERT